MIPAIPKQIGRVEMMGKWQEKKGEKPKQTNKQTHQRNGDIHKKQIVQCATQNIDHKWCSKIDDCDRGLNC